MSLASTEALRQRVLALRYQVFCDELGFGMTHRDGLESDAYDANSLHCLIQHRPSQTDVGCVRVVLPGERGGNLPFETFGLRHVDRRLLDWSRLDPTRCCEISRLAVRSSYRRPLQGNHADPSQPHPLRPHQMISVVLALYQCAVALTLHHGFEWTFMVGESRLQRHLASFGINMRQISPTFDYFGPRAVFVITRADCQASVDHWSGDRASLYDTVHNSVIGTPPPRTPTEISSSA